MRHSLLVSVVFPLLASAQSPVIQTGGVQNAASNIPLASIAPQVMIAIKGQNLSTSTAAAYGFPLPETLGGATVTFAGPNGPLRAPLFYASPTQINAQVPNGIVQPAYTGPSAGGATSLVVTTAAGSSAPYTIALVNGQYPYQIAPLGIFSQDTTGCGQAVAFNVHTDGSVALNTPQNSLDPEKDLGLTIFLTGLGGLDFPDRQDGVPWNYNSNDNLLLQPDIASPTAVIFGTPGLTATAAPLTPTYFGPAPERIAMDQLNALGQWKGAPQGCRVPLSLALLEPQTITYQGAATSAPFNSSQLVDVSIQPGGGACADPPDSGLGIVTFQKTTISDVSGTTAGDAVIAQFIEADGLGFAPAAPSGIASPPPSPQTSNSPINAVYGPVPVPPAACSASLPESLDAGALTLTGPGISSTILPRSAGTYQASLPGGTLQSGNYQVTGQGGSQVGVFTASANLPGPITAITTTNLTTGGMMGLSPGTFFAAPCVATLANGVCRGPVYNFFWTGGDDRSIVTIQFIISSTNPVSSAYGGPGVVQAVASAPASAGTIIIQTAYLPYPDAYDCVGPVGFGCTLLPYGNVEVIVTQTPAQSPPQPFSATGLAGGEATWKYVWDFRGLIN
ncbi:MAG: hypothetical protein ABSH50_16750 [Bryobacteraceae bacterium]